VIWNAPQNRPKQATKQPQGPKLNDDAGDHANPSNVVAFKPAQHSASRVLAVYTMTLTITAGKNHIIDLSPPPTTEAATQQAALLFRNGIDAWAGPASTEPEPWPEPEEEGGSFAAAPPPAPRPPPRPRRTRHKQPGLMLDPAPQPPTE
jgi:hypothetical protein